MKIATSISILLLVAYIFTAVIINNSEELVEYQPMINGGVYLFLACVILFNQYMIMNVKK